MPDALADELYNDLSTLTDLSADRIHDALCELGHDARDPIIWNSAVDIFTSNFITHCTGLNEKLRKLS